MLALRINPVRVKHSALGTNFPTSKFLCTCLESKRIVLQQYSVITFLNLWIPLSPLTKIQFYQLSTEVIIAIQKTSDSAAVQLWVRFYTRSFENVTTVKCGSGSIKLWKCWGASQSWWNDEDKTLNWLIFKTC